MLTWELDGEPPKEQRVKRKKKKNHTTLTHALFIKYATEHITQQHLVSPTVRKAHTLIIKDGTW